MNGCLSCSYKKCYFPQRYVLALMCFCGIIVGYGQRTILNLAITVMTDRNITQSKSCPFENETNRALKFNVTGGVIEWTNTQQNWIIGGFFTGYFLGHIPAGILCDKYGGRPLFLGGLAISTANTLITPVIVTHTPFFIAVVLRIIQGLAQAVMYPSISTLYARWVPLEERSLLGAFSMAANSVGVIVGNMVTGSIISFGHDWPTSFYVWALLGSAWCIVFGIYVYSEPDTHHWITNKEKELLKSKIGMYNSCNNSIKFAGISMIIDNKQHINIVPRRKMKIPWHGMLSSLSIWALIVGEIGHDLTIYTLTNSMPKYISDVLHYNIEENTIMSSLPYTTQWFGGMGAGRIADYLIRKKNYRIVWVRRIMTTIDLVVSPIFLVLGGYMGCNGNLVVIMFAICMGLKGPFFAGLKVNHLEMTVNFAGVVMAIYNGLGALAGQISPIIINAIADDNTLEEWIIIFWIIFVASAITNVFYCVFCTDKRMKWDIPPEDMEAYLNAEEEEKARKAEQKAKKAEQRAAKTSRADTS